MIAPENPEPLNGTFWQVDTPDRRVRGQLTLGDRPALETLDPISDERSILVERSSSGIVTRLGVLGNADARVADWEPRNIQGQLDDGTLVSVVGAQGRMKRSSSILRLEALRRTPSDSETPPTTAGAHCSTAAHSTNSSMHSELRRAR